MTETHSKIDWLRTGRDYLFIAFGILCYAFGWAVFLLPYNITMGGTAGVASLVFFSTGFPIQITYLLINVVLLFFATRILGKQFAIRTVWGVMIVTIAV